MDMSFDLKDFSALLRCADSDESERLARKIFSAVAANVYGAKSIKGKSGVPQGDLHEWVLSAMVTECFDFRRRISCPPSALKM